MCFINMTLYELRVRIIRHPKITPKICIHIVCMPFGMINLGNLKPLEEVRYKY